MELNTIFSVGVGVADLGRDFTDKEFNSIKKLKLKKNYGNLVSEETNILEKREFEDLKNFCLTNINDYMIKTYKPKNDISLRITQSWVNVTRAGEFHHKHRHPNSAFSASFYIATNDDDKIYFHNQNNEMLNFEVSDFNQYNSGSWWLPAKKGTMVMFPSWLEHEVRTKDHFGERISLSFNTFFVGQIGSKDMLTELKLS